VTGYVPGDPGLRLEHYKAEVAAKRMTAEQAADALFAWAQSVGWQVTRQACLADIEGRGGSVPG
jgi:hypothetical protein